MIRRGLIGLTLVVAVSVVLSPRVAESQAKATDPLEAYKEYLGVLAKATSLDPLLPYFTKELSDGYRKMPTDMQGNFLKMNKRIVSDLKVTKQSVTANKADFQLTAKDSDGNAVTGSATLIKEGGVWKIEDFAWAGPPHKG
jgi:hypothetical protein